VPALRESVQAAVPLAFEAARASLNSLRHVLRFLYPILVSTNRPLLSFANEANRMFDETPADGLLLMTAVFVSSIHRQNIPEDAIHEHIKAIQPQNVLNEMATTLTPAENRKLTEQIRKHKAN
jgi:hypothetical protein